jgi:hypothetical protein
MEPMFEDPIVKEVHEARERILSERWREGLLREFRAIEIEMRDRVVLLAPPTGANDTKS